MVTLMYNAVAMTPAKNAAAISPYLLLESITLVRAPFTFVFPGGSALASVPRPLTGVTRACGANSTAGKPSRLRAFFSSQYALRPWSECGGASSPREARSASNFRSDLSRASKYVRSPLRWPVYW